VCPTHRCYVPTAKHLPSTAERCEWLIEPTTALESALIDELIRFERHDEHSGLIHVTDPAVRRVATWLTLQVIACPAPPARLNAMRLGRASGSFTKESSATLINSA
jgi:hypothetical protein